MVVNFDQFLCVLWNIWFLGLGRNWEFFCLLCCLCEVGVVW